MNNGFPGSFTPMSNNMGLTCQPNVNGPQPGHCVLHHVDRAPDASFRHHVSSVQNRAMDNPRLPQKILIDQSELNKCVITLNKNAERLNISLSSLTNNKNDLKKQLTQAQALLSKALAEQCAAKKEAAEKIPIADEKETYFIKKWAYNAIRGRCSTVEDRIRDGDRVYRAIAQSHYQFQEWVDFRTKLIQKENAIKHLDDINLKVNDIRKQIDKIALEIKKIEAKTSAPVVKSTATAAAPAVKPAAKASALVAKAPIPAAKPATKAPAPAAKPAVTASEVPPPASAPVAKAPIPAAKPATKAPAPAAKPAVTASEVPPPASAPVAKVPTPAAKPAIQAPVPAANPPVPKSDNLSLSNLVGHSFLSNEQQAQKSKEIAECQTTLCKIRKEAQWAITDLAQGSSFAAGMVAGVPAGLYETVDGIVKTASNPGEAYSALKTLSDSGNILGNLTSAVKQSWVDSIDRMEAEYQKGSISGAFNAGVEGGKLTTDIGGLVTGSVGLLKSGVIATEKAVAKAASKADSVVKTGADMALPPASTTERMAGYMIPKEVPDTSEAARLASQQTLKNAQFMTMPPLENPFLGKGRVDRLTLATPQQTKVVEQLLDIGIKASLTGITAMTLKDVADRITADELNHITALSTAGNPAITGDYLSSLQDKYAPVHTGNTQLPDTTLRNTSGNLPLVPQTPNHTGNNQISGKGATYTGNTAGVTDSGIKTTITPIPDGPSRDDLAYLSLKGKEAQETADKLGFDRRVPPQKAPFNSHGQPVFFNGKNYITPDVDSHNISNGWKLFNNKGKRIGTYDSDLNMIKD